MVVGLFLDLHASEQNSMVGPCGTDIQHHRLSPANTVQSCSLTANNKSYMHFPNLLHCSDFEPMGLQLQLWQAWYSFSPHELPPSTKVGEESHLFPSTSLQLKGRRIQHILLGYRIFNFKTR